MDGDAGRPTAYEVLGVHPSAPSDLISACYWEHTRHLREPGDGERPNASLHALTRAYELVSDPRGRAAYDVDIGHNETPLVSRHVPRRRSLVSRIVRRGPTWSVDPHEILGLHPSAPQAVVPEAYRQMRNVYLRVPPGHKRATLLTMLEEAYSILKDPARRAQIAGASEDLAPRDPDLTTPEVRSSRPLPADSGKRKRRQATDADPRVNIEKPRRRVRPSEVFTAAWLRVRRLVTVLLRYVLEVTRFLVQISRRALVNAASYVKTWRDHRTPKRRQEASRPEAHTADELFLGRLASRVGDTTSVRSRGTDQSTSNEG
jgi:curved DNA-binding protein CbpA